jgi:hypothetical protein
MSNSNKGRKAGSKNRFTQETKEDLSNTMLPHIQGMLKSINGTSPEKRINTLLKFMPYFLTKGTISGNEAEVQAIVFNQLFPHYNKMGIYFNHLPNEKKADFLAKVIKLITPEQVSKLIPAIKKNLKKKGGDKS